MPARKPKTLRELFAKAFPPETHKRGIRNNTIAQAAKALGVRRQTLYNACDINQLPPERAAKLVKVSSGLLTAEDVFPFLDQSTLKAYRFLLGPSAR